MKHSIAFMFILLFSLNILSIPHRELIILLDYQSTETAQATLTGVARQSHENIPQGISAITLTALIALEQRAAPLLMSASLLKNIYDHKKIATDFMTLSEAQLDWKYQNRPHFSSPAARAQFKSHITYNARMLKLVHKEINKLAKSNKTAEAIFDAIIQDPRFSEMHAPADLISNETAQTNSLFYLLCWRYAPTAKNWVIKQVSDTLCLLIPKDYLATIDSKASSSFISSPELTSVEHKLGLKINHLQDTLTLSYKHKDTYGDTFVHDLAKIFVNKKEYSGTQMPRWSLYLTGHGLPKRSVYNTLEQLNQLEQFYTKKLKVNKDPHRARYYTKKLENVKHHKNRLEKSAQQIGPYQKGLILSLSLDNWRKALQFFNDNLNVSFLFYSSCFAGGEHLVTPYVDTNKKPLILHYPVVSGTLSENRAQQESPLIMLPPYCYKQQGSHTIIKGLITKGIDTQKRSLALITTLNFPAFFKHLRAQEHMQETNLHKILSTLHPYTTDNGTLIYESMGNIPSLRKANNAQFQVISPLPACITIAQQEQHNRAQQHFTLHKKQAALLYTDYVPQTLVLNKSNSRKPPIFISMLPGTAAHMFEEVQAPNYTFIELMNSFLQLPELSSSKIFWIKKLSCSYTSALAHVLNQNKTIVRDVIIMRNMCTTHNIKNSPRFEDEYAKNSIYFSVGDTAYQLSWDGNYLNEHTISLAPLKNKNHQHELLAFAPQLERYRV